VSGRAAERLSRPEVAHHFALCIQVREKEANVDFNVILLWLMIDSE
jgi:hypothetical protein